MQGNQPFYTGFQSYPPFCPYQAQSRYPDIIGEGDVISIRLPDGTVQWYFIPTYRRDHCIPNFSSTYNISTGVPFGSNNEAWFVKSFLNTYPAAGPNLIPNNDGLIFTRSYVNVNSPCQGFVQKFHNDSWTSTTDLCYFFPRLRRDWTTGYAAIQVEIPKEERTIFHYGTICNKPCNCNKKTEETPMSIDEVKSTHSCCNDSKKKEKSSKNNTHSCSCNSSSSDKAVTTFADEGVSCIDIKSSAFQTGKDSTNRTNIGTEIWYPRRKKPRRSTARTSYEAELCNCACCLSSACSDSDQSPTSK